MNLTHEAKVHLAREDYDPIYEGRPLRRAILDPLSIEILAGRFPEGQTITADVRKRKIVFES